MSTKQKSAIDTPIDRRETFMSLSKTNNDSDSSVEQKLQTLYLIQQKDSKIDSIHLLLGELPDEIRDLEDEIERLKSRVARVKEEIVDAEKFIAQKKIDADGFKALIAKYKEQQNNVKNNREYNSLTHELEYQELQLEAAEKKIREKKAKVVELNSIITASNNELQQRESDLEAKKVECNNIIEETEKEEDILKQEIAELKSKIDARTLAAYEKVRANTSNGYAVVTVERDACGGCFNKIPPQRKLDIAMNKKIIVCEYCGRILIDAEMACKETI